MSYSQNDLQDNYRFVNGIRFTNGANVTLGAIQTLLKEEADSNGIPVSFQSDTLKTGGLFSKQSEEVLVLYHPQHPSDYLRFMVRVTYQGKYAFMDVFKVGGSKNFARDNKATDSVGQGLFNALTGHKQKLEEEEKYYVILKDCFENVVS